MKRRLWLDRCVRSQQRKTLRVAGYEKSFGGKRTSRLPIYIATVPRLLIAEKQEQREQILAVIDSIRSRLGEGGRVKVDFSKVEKIFPGGMLLLLAALERLADSHKGRLWARCPPNSLPAQLLSHFGLSAKLRVNAMLSRPTSEKVVTWQYLTGTQAAGEEVHELLNGYRSNTQAQIPDGLFAVLTEGLTNVRHHAYTGTDNVDEASKRWWLFARLDEPVAGKDGSLFVAIYDMGVGISTTMRRKLNKGEVILKIADKVVDHISASALKGNALEKALLFSAVEHKRSQTGQPHRGNGLPEMREFAESTPGGRLHIVSGSAQYSFVPGAVQGQTNGFKVEFPGTLLLWSLPLKAKYGDGYE